MHKRSLEITCQTITPFTPAGEVDEPALRAHIGRLIDAGVGVNLCAPGGGEGHSLTLAEREKVYRIGVDECRGRVPTGAYVPEARNAENCIEGCKLAIASGADSITVLCVDPGHGMRPTRGELETFYRDVLSAIDYPTALTLHPGMSPVLPMSIIRSLCQDYPHIVTLNAYGVSNAFFVELLDTVGPRIRVWTELADSLKNFAFGASGCSSSEPNVLPRLCRSVVDAYQNGDVVKAGTQLAHVTRFSAVASKWGPGSARWAKMALRNLGLPGGAGAIRKPYVFPSQKDFDELAVALERLGVRALEGLN